MTSLFAVTCYFFVALQSSVPEADPRTAPQGMAFDIEVAYGNESARQVLDILYFKEIRIVRPAVIHIHGGGWYTGDKGGESTFALMKRFAEAGFVAVSMNYRFSDEAPFPAAVQDAKRAVRWLKANAEKYGVDPNRVAAIGASAGGHLAAMLALTQPKDGLEGEGILEYPSSVRAAVPVCAPFDLAEEIFFKVATEKDPNIGKFLPGTLEEKRSLAPKASPLTYVHPEGPPMLIVHGTDDKAVPVDQAQHMETALHEVNAPCESIIVEGGKHGMGIAREEPVLTRIVEFLKQHLHATPGAPTQTIAAWQQKKFGMFVHWNPSSLRGEEISWSRGGTRPGLPDLPPGAIPVEEYDALYKEFNPTKFNADEWVAIAKSAGMKYLVITTKHHDGFCMFDSKLTEFSIMHSPFGRDIVAELAEACRKGGIGFGVYYSLPDWHHPDFLTDRHAEYIEYLHGQIRELCTNYGPLECVWFDGGKSGTVETWDSERLLQLVRELQPAALVNNRTLLPGDFDTPEQVVGRYDYIRPWESCITIGQQWGWKPNDDLKSVDECIMLLARCVGGGGNLALNVGPMPTGEIDPSQVHRLKQVGEWIAKNGHTLVDAQGGPYPPSYWGASTHQGNSVFLHLFEGWESGLILPPMELSITGARTADGSFIDITQDSQGLHVNVLEPLRRQPLTTVALDLEGSAATIAIKPTGVGIPEGTTASASNVRRNEPNYGAAMAVDDDPLSRWATDDGVTATWIEIALPHPIAFDVILIDEAFGSRVQAFHLQANENGEWKTFYTGTTMGRNWAAKFAPVRTQQIRIDIPKATDGPTIRDVQFHYVSNEGE
ncbi:MAG: hypothetical protein AMXMBFR84_38840 [Candidatus Hydrogenedentota bacterium]